MLFRRREPGRAQARAGGPDLRRMLRREIAPEDAATGRLEQTAFAQPALFAVEYALARLLDGVGDPARRRCSATASASTSPPASPACSPSRTRCALVARRGAADRRSCRRARCSAVPLPEAEIRAAARRPSCRSSAINGRAVCVVAGPAAAVAELGARGWRREGVACRRLQTTHAFHSAMMEPALDALADAGGTRRACSRRASPICRNVTGTWITAEEATDPAYWARHMRHRALRRGAAELLADASRVYLEVGPGQTLGSLILQHPASGAAGSKPPLAIASLRHAFETQPDQAFLLQALGRYWTAGAKVDWSGFHAGERRRRVALPSYPFERQRHWIEAASRGAAARGRLAAGGTGERLQAFAWRRSQPLPPWPPAGHRPERHTWLLFLDELGVGERLADRLERLGQDTVRVKKGDGFARPGERAFVLDPRDPAGYEALLASMGAVPDQRD